MNYLEYYLGQHRDNRVIYYLGIHSDFKSLIQSLKICHFDEFYLLFEDHFHHERVVERILKDSDKTILDQTKIITIDEAESLLKKDPKFTLVLDSVCVLDTLFRLTKHHPKKVIGCFYTYVSTFELWEVFKNDVEEISLATKINDYKIDVLSWKKDKNNDVELSIILPVYNVGKYLDKCIETVCEWDAPYVEFLFVNDGSPDNSAEIIKNYSKKDPRIKLLNKVNGGCASAREFGMEHAKGRYIGFVDPDDFVDPDMFKTLMKNAMRGGYDVSYCKYHEYYEDTHLSREIDDLTTPVYQYGTSDLKAIDDLIAYLRVAIWRCIFRREFIENNDIHFYTDLKRFDDLPFKVETFARAKSVICEDEALYFYRLGREGQDVSVHDRRLFVHFDIFKHLDVFFLKPRRSEQLMLYHQVKIQTHYWGLMNLDKEFEKEYLALAAEDLQIKNNKSSWKKEISKYYQKAEVKVFMKKMF